VFPLFSIFLARMMVSLTYLSILENPEGSEYDDEAKFSALLFFILGIASLIVTTFQLLIFGVIGESITRKLRIETYNKILRMPIPWFDLPRNNGGSLTARLSTDCQSVNGIVTTTISVVVQNLSTLISGLIIAFFYEWRTSLVALGLIPFMMLSGAIQMNLNTGFSDKTDKAYKDSSNLIMESMINIRTVNSFGYEGIIAKKYDQRMEEPY
jgi:ATP-binding cassette subfamily B (MDR/TAP) protein 1